MPAVALIDEKLTEVVLRRRRTTLPATRLDLTEEIDRLLDERLAHSA